MSGADYSYPLANYLKNLSQDQLEKYEEYAKNFFESLPRIESKLVKYDFKVQPKTDSFLSCPWNAKVIKIDLSDLNEYYNKTKR